MAETSVASAGPTASRRGIISGLALAPLALAPVAMSVPAYADPSNFRSALAAFEQANRAAEAYDMDVLEPLLSDYHSRLAAIPHTEVQWAANPHFDGETWSTADTQRIRNARYFLDPRHTAPFEVGHADYQKACVALLAAVEARDARIAQLRGDCGIDAAYEESQRLMELSCRAQEQVIACPVSSASEFAAKIEFVNAQEQWDFDGTREAISADAPRLAAGARSYRSHVT